MRCLIETKYVNFVARPRRVIGRETPPQKPSEQSDTVLDGDLLNIKKQVMLLDMGF